MGCIQHQLIFNAMAMAINQSIHKSRNLISLAISLPEGEKLPRILQ
jgi:hypothetical protein